MRRPRILDLFCKAGGAAKGYADAGWEVVGVDIEPQPNYPYAFHWCDALAMVQDVLQGCWHENYSKSALAGMHPQCLGHFDAIHASPPCQRFSDLAKRNGNAEDWPDLIEPVRDLLQATGLPYVIENVEGAPLIDPITLCGTMFPEAGLRVIRHRLFELGNWSFSDRLPHPKHPLVFTHDKRKNHYNSLDQDTSFVQVTGGGNCTVKNKRDAMGVPWMTGAEANEAIPPAFTTFMGEQLRHHIEHGKRPKSDVVQDRRLRSSAGES